MRSGQLRSGQFSVEFIVVLGVLLALLASVSLPLYSRAREDAERVSGLGEARGAANEIASALNTVYSGGIGSKQTVEYWLPEKVLEIRVAENVDGTDGISSNSRMDVQILFDWEDDNLVVVDTLLPSEDYENWQGYPVIEVINGSLSTGAGDHTVTVEYRYLQIEIEEV
ncbi:MAG: hypothetical protein U9M97_03315 [Candidatus Hadarchaeota archaeon]|nr:hypothetical protein [Candidatus Hadarchaeota archaeon]